MDRNKLALAELLAEVKLAEKKVGKAKAKLPAMEAKIKQALMAGKRELAKKFALDYEEQKLEVKRCEQNVVLCKKQYEVGKSKARSATSAKTLRSMEQVTKAMNGMADSLDKLSADDDMVRKLEEGAAYAEARLDIAIDEARTKNPEIDMPVESAGGEALPPMPSSAEDILKEFE